jgi:hypothetical protein
MATKDSVNESMTVNDGAPAQRLLLRRETLRSLRVQTRVRTGLGHAHGGDPNSGPCPGESYVDT